MVGFGGFGLRSELSAGLDLPRSEPGVPAFEMGVKTPYLQDSVMRHKITAAVLLAVMLLSSTPAFGQVLDCYTLLRGTEARLGGDHQPRPLSDDEFLAAISRRVCVMTFVEIDALRPFLEANPNLARLLTRLDTLKHNSKLNNAMDEEVRRATKDLFNAVHELPSRELGAIADLLRRGGSNSLGSYDPLQAELFARYLQAQQLRREGDFRAIARVVEELRANTRAGRLVDTGRIDEVEKDTYFRAETLWSALNAIELHALSSISPPGAPQVVSYIARRLDIPESSLSVLPTPEVQHLLNAASDSLANLVRDVDLPAIRHLSGVAGASDTDEYLDIYLRSSRGLPAKVLRYSKRGGLVELLDAEPVFEAHVRSLLSRNSTPEFRLVNVMRSDDSFTLQFADGSVELTADDVRSLHHGIALPNAHGLTEVLRSSDAPLVVYSHPLMHEGSHYLREAEEIAFAIQESYPTVRVYRDDFDELATPAKVRAIEELSVAGSERLVALIAEESFRVEDLRVLQNAQAELEDLGVEVVRWASGATWEQGSDRTVIVISGHIDEAMERFVEELGQAGVLERNYVVFASCYEDLSSTLIRRMNTIYRAAGTFRFDGAVNAHDVGEAVVDLAERLRQGQGSVGFAPTLGRAIRGAGLRGVWTVCVNGLTRRAVYG